MRFLPSGLWRQETFLKLWASQTLTHAGFQMQYLAVPLVAALLLDATPLQMGILASFGGAPAIVVGVFAGIWIDRRSKRAVLIGAAWGNALAFLVIATSAWLGFLSIPLLFAVAFALGGLRFIVDVTYRAFLPSLVLRTQLIEANSKLEVGRSATEIGGPGSPGPSSKQCRRHSPWSWARSPTPARRCRSTGCVRRRMSRPGQPR